MRRSRVLGGIVAVLVLGVLAVPAAGFASPPSNDNFADATLVTSLPFSDSVGITEATIEPGEPLAYYREDRTVWWTFTAATSDIYRITTSSDYPAASFVLYAQTGSGLGGLAWVTRLYPSWSGHTFTPTPGTTYYIQAGDEYGYGWVNSVGISLDVVQPPANDDFADAISFSNDDLPLNASFDMTAASLEPGEPNACGASYTQTAWYAFTPTVSGSYGGFAVSNVAVYTGTSLEALTNVACADWPGLYFYAEAGTTYYLQSYGGGVNVDVVPPPNADFTYSPGDPSALDDTSFWYENWGYWDPTVTGYSWEFGDGATATGSPVTHRFARDGDYTVTITVEARGGRTATATKTVEVRTHDVSIMSFVTPKKSQVGKTGVITVGIGNTRYPETVQVDVYRITPQGNVLVNTGIQAVAVKKLKKTTVFSLNYTFTSDDQAAGKVNFQAVATIQGARDALPSDNTATSTPTLVGK